MDYQALFQEYIQQGTLLDKTCWGKSALKSPKHLWTADKDKKTSRCILRPLEVAFIVSSFIHLLSN